VSIADDSTEPPDDGVEEAPADAHEKRDDEKPDEAEKPEKPAIPERLAKPARKRARWLVAIVGAYALATVVAAFLVHAWVDKMWAATLLAFLPRWLMALPAPLVLGACAWKRDAILGATVTACLALQAFLIGGLRVGIGCSSAPREKELRIMTQNAKRTPFGEGWVAKLVRDEDLDLLLVQECPLEGGASPPVPAGFSVATDINTCLFSRYPIAEEDARPSADVWERGGSGAIALYRIEAPIGAVYVMNVHLATVREGISGFRHFFFGGRETMRESTRLRAWESSIAREWSRRAKGPLLVAGDFNMPEESSIYDESWGDLGNAFDACGSGFGYSKETVVRHVEFGTRIDHVLFDDHWTCHEARLGPDIGSDHRGMIAAFTLK
jgi:endonuclease/exonuclease/phosphatase (EEP) superfamily protein YafD